MREKPQGRSNSRERRSRSPTRDFRRKDDVRKRSLSPRRQQSPLRDMQRARLDDKQSQETTTKESSKPPSDLASETSDGTTREEEPSDSNYVIRLSESDHEISETAQGGENSELSENIIDQTNADPSSTISSSTADNTQPLQEGEIPSKSDFAKNQDDKRQYNRQRSNNWRNQRGGGGGGGRGQRGGGGRRQDQHQPRDYRKDNLRIEVNSNSRRVG
jgi:hypothetical protein